MKNKKEKRESKGRMGEFIIFLLHMVTVVGLIDTLVYEGVRIVERLPHDRAMNQVGVSTVAPASTQVPPASNSKTVGAENQLATAMSKSEVTRP